jgi:hypothetical protein
MGYGFDARGSIPSMGKRFYPLLYSVRIGSGAHLASYPVGTGGSFLKGKAASEIAKQPLKWRHDEIPVRFGVSI